MLDPHTQNPWLPNSLLTFFCDTMLPWFEANRPDRYNSFLEKRKVASIEEYRGIATSTEQRGDAGSDEIVLFNIYTGVHIEEYLSAGAGLFVGAQLPSPHTEVGELVEPPWRCPPGTNFKLVMENNHWSYLGTPSSWGHKASTQFPAPSPAWLRILERATEDRKLFGDVAATWRRLFGGGDAPVPSSPPPGPSSTYVSYLAPHSSPLTPSSFNQRIAAAEVATSACPPSHLLTYAAQVISKSSYTDTGNLDSVAAASTLLAESIGKMSPAALIAATESLLALQTALKAANNHPVLVDLEEAVEAGITICQGQTLGTSSPFSQAFGTPFSGPNYASLHLPAPPLRAKGTHTHQCDDLHRSLGDDGVVLDFDHIADDDFGQDDDGVGLGFIADDGVDQDHCKLCLKCSSATKTKGACFKGGGPACRRRAFEALSKEDRTKVLEDLQQVRGSSQGIKGRALVEHLVFVSLPSKDDNKAVANALLPHMRVPSTHELKPDVRLLVSTCTSVLRLRTQWDSSEEGQKACTMKLELRKAHNVILEFCLAQKQQATSTKPPDPDQMDGVAVSGPCEGASGPSIAQGSIAGQDWVQHGPSASTPCGTYHPEDEEKRVRECFYCHATDPKGQHKIASRRCKQDWKKRVQSEKGNEEPEYGSDLGQLVSSCRYCGYKGTGRYHEIGSVRCRRKSSLVDNSSLGDDSCPSEVDQKHSKTLPGASDPPLSAPAPAASDLPLPTPISSLPVFSSEDAQQSFLQNIGLVGPASAPALLICGAPGTGKSFVTQRLVSVLRNLLKSDKAVALTAPTGLLARDIGGVTVHSWAGIGTAKQLDCDYLYENMSAAAKQRWIEAKVLVLDDASLIAAELFDCLEVLARRVRSQPDHFFGGLFIVLQFDLGQLHPVKCRCDSCKAFEHGGDDDDEDPIRTPLYNSDWWEGFLHNGQNAPLCVCLSNQWRFGSCVALRSLIDALRSQGSTPLQEEDHLLLEKDQFADGPCAPCVPTPIYLCPRNDMVGARTATISLPASSLLLLLTSQHSRCLALCDLAPPRPAQRPHCRSVYHTPHPTLLLHQPQHDLEYGFPYSRISPLPPIGSFVAQPTDPCVLLS